MRMVKPDSKKNTRILKYFISTLPKNKRNQLNEKDDRTKYGCNVTTLRPTDRLEKTSSQKGHRPRSGTTRGRWIHGEGKLLEMRYFAHRQADLKTFSLF